MNDLEIKRKCAAAMGVEISEDGLKFGLYNPLESDAQAMAMVKKFRLNIGQIYSGDCEVLATVRGKFYESEGTDLNRAICECVARIVVEDVEV